MNLLGAPLVADLNGDNTDDLILWGNEDVGDATCSRVWIFNGGPERNTLATYDHRINFETSIHAVSVATTSQLALNLVVLVEGDGEVALARYAPQGPIMAPLLTLPDVGSAPYTLFETAAGKIYVGGRGAHYEGNFEGPGLTEQKESFIPWWPNVLAIGYDGEDTVFAVSRNQVVRGRIGDLDVAKTFNFAEGKQIEQFILARPEDMGLQPSFLYGVGVSSTTDVLFLRPAPFPATHASFASLTPEHFGVAAAAAKIERGDQNTTPTAAAVIQQNLSTAQRSLLLFDQGDRGSKISMPLDIPATHVAAGKFRTSSPSGAGEVFVFKTNPPADECFTLTRLNTTATLDACGP